MEQLRMLGKYKVLRSIGLSNVFIILYAPKISANWHDLIRRPEFVLLAMVNAGQGMSKISNFALELYGRESYNLLENNLTALERWIMDR